MKNVMGQGRVSNQSGTSWYPVITASSYKVALVIMFLIRSSLHLSRDDLIKPVSKSVRTSVRLSVRPPCSFVWRLCNGVLRN